MRSAAVAASSVRMGKVARSVLGAAPTMEMGLVLVRLASCCRKWQGSCSAKTVSPSAVVVRAPKMLAMGVLLPSS